MPTVYVDRHLMGLIRERASALGDAQDGHVPEKRALETLLSDEVREELERRREEDA